MYFKLTINKYLASQTSKLVIKNLLGGLERQNISMTSMYNQVERHNKTITMMSSHVTKELNRLSRRISELEMRGKMFCKCIDRLV